MGFGGAEGASRDQGEVSQLGIPGAEKVAEKVEDRWYIDTRVDPRLAEEVVETLVNDGEDSEIVVLGMDVAEGAERRRADLAAVSSSGAQGSTGGGAERACLVALLDGVAPEYESSQCARFFGARLTRNSSSIERAAAIATLDGALARGPKIELHGAQVNVDWGSVADMSTLWSSTETESRFGPEELLATALLADPEIRGVTFSIGGDCLAFAEAMNFDENVQLGICLDPYTRSHVVSQIEGLS
ncbi:hypothetical protein GCM10027062_21810 [Nocardioides hungaricus]